MSCRVQRKRVEHAAFAHMAGRLTGRGQAIRGRLPPHRAQQGLRRAADRSSASNRRPRAGAGRSTSPSPTPRSCGWSRRRAPPPKPPEPHGHEADRPRRLRRHPPLLVKPAPLRPDAAIASLSFDDFPRSAWTVGGPILARHGVRATYYVAGRFCGGQEDGLDYYDEARTCAPSTPPATRSAATASAIGIRPRCRAPSSRPTSSRTSPSSAACSATSGCRASPTLWRGQPAHQTDRLQALPGRARHLSRRQCRLGRPRDSCAPRP